ncbi:hypothetical protein [Bacillus sp. EB600]|uniref:hypothetical protein n=1 Tax=Bacillus sp. EB600 TaxID=2806345 RepID=UPI00210B8239|nr:hypothetical protein [Bacillus sp. EB600]MCQ6282702.1 hypothetical protein [Bacillus sp. EB600]
MKKAIIIAIISILALTGCQKEVKQYKNGKLVFEGTVDANGLPEKGKLYDSQTGKIAFEGIFRNGLMLKGTLYDKNGKNPRSYQE